MTCFRCCFHGGLGDSVRQGFAADFSLPVPKERGAEFSCCFQDFGVKWVSVIICFAEPKFVRRHTVVCFSIFRGPLKGCFSGYKLGRTNPVPPGSFSLFCVTIRRPQDSPKREEESRR